MRVSVHLTELQIINPPPHPPASTSLPETDEALQARSLILYGKKKINQNVLNFNSSTILKENGVSLQISLQTLFHGRKWHMIKYKRTESFKKVQQSYKRVCFQKHLNLDSDVSNTQWLLFIYLCLFGCCFFYLRLWVLDFYRKTNTLFDPKHFLSWLCAIAGTNEGQN